jgi:hypothetical protein
MKAFCQINGIKATKYFHNFVRKSTSGWNYSTISSCAIIPLGRLAAANNLLRVTP